MVFEEALQNVAFGLVRIGSFVANAILFGLPVVLLLVLRPALAAGSSSLAGDASEGSAAVRRRLASRLEGFVQAALWAAAVGAGLTIVLQAVVAPGIEARALDARSLAEVVETSFGRWFLLRFPLLAALAVLLVGRVRRSATAAVGETEERGPNGLWWGAWAALGLALLSTSSFSGHAAVSSPLALALLNDVLHLASGATWFTGVVVLAAVLPKSLRALDASDRVAILAPVVMRFSAVALVSISVVALTGTFNSFFNVEAPDDLIGSGYGRLLTAKILLFVGVLVFGGINHFYVRRRLENAREQGSIGARRLFRKTIAIELALALLLISVTGILVGSARTRPSALSGETPVLRTR